MSNLAWEAQYDAAIAAVLQDAGVDAIDVVPGRYFPDPASVAPDDAYRVRDVWRERGVQIVGMQSLLFGTTGLNLFGDAAVQDAMLRHLDGVCRLGRALGATRLAFGSPRNRDASGLEPEQAAGLAVAFFRRLGEAAFAQGVVVCLEANPVAFGCNFLTTTEEAGVLVRRIDHPGIRLQFDTGAVFTNGEDLDALLAAFGDLVGHVHLSEPGLAPLSAEGRDHASTTAALRRAFPEAVVTIEMLPAEPRVEAVARAVRAARAAVPRNGASSC